MYQALRVDMTLLMCNFTSVRSAVGVPTSPGWWTLSPPTVSQVRWTSALIGFSSHTNVVYVTSFHLLLGTWSLRTKYIASVSWIRPPTPCASWPNSFAGECIHTSQYFGWVINLQYFKSFPDSSSKTSFANSDLVSSMIACANSNMLSGVILSVDWFLRTMPEVAWAYFQRVIGPDGDVVWIVGLVLFKMSFIFCNTSISSFPQVLSLCWNAEEISPTAFIIWSSGVTVGRVMYRCWKNTVSEILLLRVFLQKIVWHQ